MEQQLERLFEKVKLEMEKQTDTIMERIDNKLRPIIEENKQLKVKVESLEKKVEFLERDKRNNNIIIHGLREEEKFTWQLLKSTKETLEREYGIMLEDYEVNKIHRIGKATNGERPRPIILGLVSGIKKGEILRNKKKSDFVRFTEDYSKETMERRRELQPKLIEERNKGNIAYLKYDKLIIRENTNAEDKSDKRKREPSTSPKTDLQPRKQQILNTPRNSRTNAYDIMRGVVQQPSTSGSAKKL